MADDTPQEPQDRPQIIVDDDWKEQARREKEQLQAKLEAEKAAQASTSQGTAAGGQAAGTAGGRRPGEMPKANFQSLVSSLATQAVVSLQGIQVEGQPPMPPDLPTARFFIDLLLILKDKTQGNLEASEQQLLDGVISELQMAFVDVSTQLQQLLQEAAKNPPGGPAAPPRS